MKIKTQETVLFCALGNLLEKKPEVIHFIPEMFYDVKNLFCFWKRLKSLFPIRSFCSRCCIPGKWFRWIDGINRYPLWTGCDFNALRNIEKYIVTIYFSCSWGRFPLHLTLVKPCGVAMPQWRNVTFGYHLPAIILTKYFQHFFRLPIHKPLSLFSPSTNTVFLFP